MNKHITNTEILIFKTYNMYYIFLHYTIHCTLYRCDSLSVHLSNLIREIFNSESLQIWIENTYQEEMFQFESISSLQRQEEMNLNSFISSKQISLMGENGTAKIHFLPVEVGGNKFKLFYFLPVNPFTRVKQCSINPFTPCSGGRR